MSATIAAAHLSGPLGQALAVVDGETWLYETDSERRRPTANDIRLFFDYGLEVRPLSPSEIAGLANGNLRSVLDVEARRFRALRGLLIGMDPLLDEPLREQGMRRSDRLLADPVVDSFVTPRFLRPADGQTWSAKQARDLAKAGGLARAARLYDIVSGMMLVELEDNVRQWSAEREPSSLAGAMAVRRAYDSGLIAAMAIAMHAADRAGIQGLVFKADAAGWDRRLVVHLAASAAPRDRSHAVTGPEREETDTTQVADLDPVAHPREDRGLARRAGSRSRQACRSSGRRRQRSSRYGFETGR